MDKKVHKNAQKSSNMTFFKGGTNVKAKAKLLTERGSAEMES